MNLDFKYASIQQISDAKVSYPKILWIHFFLLLDADGGLFPLAIVKKCFVLDVMPHSRI